jgi:hypothetical protein
MTGLRANTALLDRLRQASQRRPSAEEIRKQRVSFIMGSLKPDSTVSRERIEQVLDKHEGRKAEV